MRRFLKDRVAALTARLLPLRVLKDPRYFDLWQARGIHITPVHFYQPVPDTRALGPGIWNGARTSPGVDFREAEQRALLEEFAARYRPEYAALPRTRGDGRPHFYLENGGFRSVDAEVLYCMIRRFRPRRMIEIGSGQSTLLAAQALVKNAGEAGGHPCRFTTIDPFPDPEVRAGVAGVDEVLAREVQSVSLETFADLGENDILFIDSSHVLRIGSDVQHEFLEILPRLRPGVLVHVHDIFLPAEYPRRWILEHKRFWTEQYLLQAFLAFNDVFQVMFAASYLHLTRADDLARVFPSYDRSREWPGSFWMRRIR